ncbi:helix-turn-helix domain-containing protein [Thermohalobaculum sediminis]|uniref:helix-turn-helix domain-containing protein n=1 Tax=Thermohalobaculum sediminis TaxID=2939436 RepID=UPI0029E7EAA7|nr:helix-turn-helix domain-containing protein [Limibaculum sediminis]
MDRDMNGVDGRHSSVSPARRVDAWSSRHLADYGVVAPMIPVREESVIQTKPGASKSDVSIVQTDDVSAVRVRHDIQSVGVTVLRPGRIALILFKPSSNNCRINGAEASVSTLYLPFKGESFHIVGASRDVIGVVLHRRKFAKTLAALQGIGVEDLALPELMLQLNADVSSGTRKRLNAIFDLQCKENAEAGGLLDAEHFDRMVFGLLADTLMSGLSKLYERAPPPSRPNAIVRKAEERFMAADGTPVSLADLCLAAGVGKSVLYEAFHAICGEPPLSYFYKRRLNSARSALLSSPHVRGAVTRAAMDSGFTELGRFSVEYRALFGELPSVTLRSSSAE